MTRSKPMRAAELAATRLCCDAFGQRENQSHPRPSPPTDDAVDDAAKSRELSIDQLPDPLATSGDAAGRGRVGLWMTLEGRADIVLGYAYLRQLDGEGASHSPAGVSRSTWLHVNRPCRQSGGRRRSRFRRSSVRWIAFKGMFADRPGVRTAVS